MYQAQPTAGAARREATRKDRLANSFANESCSYTSMYSFRMGAQHEELGEAYGATASADEVAAKFASVYHEPQDKDLREAKICAIFD